MLAVFVVLTIIAYFLSLRLQDLSFSIGLLLPGFPLHSRLFIFFFKSLILFDCTKLSISLKMFLAFCLLDAPDAIIFFALRSLVDWAARIVLFENFPFGIGVIVIHQLLLLAFSAFI